MYRHKHFLLTAFLLSFLLFVLPSNANETTKDFKYTVLNNRVTITKYTGSTSDLKIPSMIQGIPVDAIAPYAFKNSTIKKLTIPSGVTTIDFTSLYNCKNLTTLVLPDSLLDITSTDKISTFTGCTKLKYISVSPKNKHYFSKDNILYQYVTSASNTILKKMVICYYPSAKKAKSYQLPENLSWMPVDSYITKNGSVFNNPYLQSFSLCTPKKFSAKKKTLKTKATISTGTNATKKTTQKSFRITLKWNRISPASGYELFESSKKNGKYKKIATIYQSYNAAYPDKSSYVLYRTYSKKSCYYKLRAFTNGYKKGKRSVIYSSYTSPIKI